jgi:GT2 family glycosyltransferase
VPTAILQIELDALPSALLVDRRYDSAMIVVRRRGRVWGRFYVAVADGVPDIEACANGVQAILRQRAATWRLEDYLGQPPSTLPAATVAICTRERPDDLTRALGALVNLDPPPAGIIVIDNAPASDRTAAVVSLFAGVRYVREDRRGLDAARNRALREATTSIVAFTDDDAVPEPAWLAHLLAPFEDPRVWCTTGLTLPLELETPAQEIFERYSTFARGFDRQLFDGTRHDPVSVARVGAGANMAVRRSVLTELGGFDEALDAGTPTRSGGDHEMFGRILAGGHRIVYEPAAVSWHRHRRTWGELRETLHGYGVGVYAMWTRRLLRDRELGVLRHALGWLRHGQLPGLVRSLTRRPGSMPLHLLTAELRGCLAGPAAYLLARRRMRAEGAR